MTEPMLQIAGVTKRYGGVVASDGITLDIPHGEFHAIIGPNGAGKTTLIGLLAGEITPLSGTIKFNGSDVTGAPVHRRSKLGLARSFQITSLFPDFTALDNVALAVQAHAGHSFRFWQDALRDNALRAPAAAALARVGLSGRADTKVNKLSHGEKPHPGQETQPQNRARLPAPATNAAAGGADGRHGAGRIRPHGRHPARTQ